MTTNARLVLADCQEAHAELVDRLQGSEWRRRWATVVVLMRTTLHVLDKVDGENDGVIRRVVDDAWEREKPVIFTDFIDSGRNLLLKEYVDVAGQNCMVHLGVGSTITYSMQSGPYEGQDPRAVAQLAIDWLRQYLN
jgi:hypothetical protein